MVPGGQNAMLAMDFAHQAPCWCACSALGKQNGGRPWLRWIEWFYQVNNFLAGPRFALSAKIHIAWIFMKTNKNETFSPIEAILIIQRQYLKSTHLELNIDNGNSHHEHVPPLGDHLVILSPQLI
jgi:hypothetical protein